MPFKAFLLLTLLASGIASPLWSEDRAARVRGDLERALEDGRWIYNDLPRGFEEARRTGKPLLVVIRCIPCEACRGFDEQVARFDPRVEGLLDRFVRVRIPQANGLDLSLFQFDFDLSFFAFFLNADRTIYGRFGSRSTQEDKVGDVSLQAFREALEAVLALHSRYDEVKGSLKGKTGSMPALKIPEAYPSLEGKYPSRIDYAKEPVRSCIHCHQVRDAERLMLREARKPIPDEVLYPWPLPEVLGLRLDPHRRAAVASVDRGSAAEVAGFRPGDELITVEGQPIVSIADVQWILQGSPDVGKLATRVRRGTEELSLEVHLDSGWRRRSDISWRVTTWDLRRMGTGGLLLADLPDEERRRAGLASDGLALLVKHVGEYGEHAVAKRAGFQKGDIIIALDGRKERLRETDFIAYTVQAKARGDRIVLSVLRGGEKKDLSFSLQ